MFQSISYEDLKSKEAILAIINSNEFKDIFTSNNIDNVIEFSKFIKGKLN